VSDEAAEERSAPEVPKRWRFLRPSAPTPPDDDTRQRIRTLDDTERKFGFAGVALILAVAALFIPSLLHNTKQTYTAKAVKGACPPGWDKPVHDTCTNIVIQHPSDFVFRFVAILALGLLLLYAVWASKRTLVVFTSFLCGLAAGTLGLLLLFYGGWLLLRSWRVQRYGTTNSREIRSMATERAAERREAKRSARTPQASPSPGKGPVTASKRYTPKAKPRRR
jgi:hypothetical protein